MDVRRLQSNMGTFRRLAKDSLVYCEDAHKAFVEWDALLMELRQNVLAKQGEIASRPPLPDPPAAVSYLPEPDPPVSSLPFSTWNFWRRDYVPHLSDSFWLLVPSIEACFRRLYKCLTSGPGGNPLGVSGVSPG